MRLGIFGGSFDPVHYGHLLLAESCREQLVLDEVWLVPAHVSPHKQHAHPADGATRVEMLKLAVAGHPQLVVSTLELDREGVSYTVDTLDELRQQDTNRELLLLMGADSLYDLPRWRDPKRICQLATLAVVQRPGSPEVDFGCLREFASPEQISLFRRHVVTMPMIGISSSDIRSRTAQGRSIRYLTPRSVEKYIETQGLYGDPEPEVEPAEKPPSCEPT